MFSVYLIHIVFTFPEALWGRCVENPKLMVDAVYKLFSQYDGMKGGVLALHFTHSRNPVKGFYPHVHVLLLNTVACRMPVFGSNGLMVEKHKRKCSYFFKRKRPYFNDFWLRVMWKGAVRSVFNYEFDGYYNVYVEYVKFNDRNEAKIKHLLRYAFRLPILDFRNVCYYIL